jgi:hypothetical protein
MNDYIGIGILVIVLIISYLIARKDFKNWNETDSVRKSFIIRALVGISAIIIILIYKIIKSH